MKGDVNAVGTRLAFGTAVWPLQYGYGLRRVQRWKEGARTGHVVLVVLPLLNECSVQLALPFDKVVEGEAQLLDSCRSADRLLGKACGAGCGLVHRHEHEAATEPLTL